MEDKKNVILAVVLSMLVFVGWQYFFVQPQIERERQARLIQKSIENPETTGTSAPVMSDQVTVPPSDSTNAGPTDTPSLAAASLTRTEAISKSEHVPIDTPSLSGGISLIGGRIDDLTMKKYRETLASDSNNVSLLSPPGASDAYYALYGWLPEAANTQISLPLPNTQWQIESGDVLAIGKPITLKWENDAGLTFRRTYEIDDKYMFTIRQNVTNESAHPVNLAPYGIIARHGEPETSGFYILHEGALGIFDGELIEEDYSDIRDFDLDQRERGAARQYNVSRSGWLGFTDKYWMTAMAPKSEGAFTAVFKSVRHGTGEIFQADMRLPTRRIGSGQSVSVESILFAGAKEVRTIENYQENLHLFRFVDAVDWGWFAFLTKPLFKVLILIRDQVTNMGLAIILLTVLVKLVLFPLAHKSYSSMARMKTLQPEMEKIKERCGDDAKKMQQEMIALYKKEKVNPASGCLPILLQIPIFFSLYKVLFVTIEMRHAPFIGWIHDLAAPDPTSIFNLFGLIPWSPPDLLQIGILPVLMGVTMWMQQKLSPAPTDKTQATIFGMMPIVFTFLLGRFPVGLVIYWTANNVLTFIQQYVIMRRQGAEVDFFGNVKRSFKRKAKPK